MSDPDLPVFDTPEELEAFLQEHLPEEDPPPPSREQVRHWIDHELAGLDVDELSFFHELLAILRHPSPSGLYHLSQEVLLRMEKLLGEQEGDEDRSDEQGG